MQDRDIKMQKTVDSKSFETTSKVNFATLPARLLAHSVMPFLNIPENSKTLPLICKGLHDSFNYFRNTSNYKIQKAEQLKYIKEYQKFYNGNNYDKNNQYDKSSEKPSRSIGHSRFR